MAVSIKSSAEIELMREAGRILAKTHEELEKSLKPGMSTWDIDRIGEEIIRSYGCIPSFKNYNGYPASICVSVARSLVASSSLDISIPLRREMTLLRYSSGAPREYMQETDATIITSLRSARARVALWRSLSISSLMELSFSM